MQLPSAVTAARQSTARAVCQNLSSQRQQEGGEGTAKAPQQKQCLPVQGLRLGCSTWGTLGMMGCSQQPEFPSQVFLGWEGLEFFDGLPEINNKLTPMKVLLWCFYCLEFRSLLWPQSLNFPLTHTLEQVKHHWPQCEGGCRGSFAGQKNNIKVIFLLRCCILLSTCTITHLKKCWFLQTDGFEHASVAKHSV